MLVLSRKVSEEIVVGENVRTKVVAIQGNKVRIGIEAPDHVSIRREEIPSREIEFSLIPPGGTGHFRATKMSCAN
jgi:carbon storage regulator